MVAAKSKSKRIAAAVGAVVTVLGGTVAGTALAGGVASADPGCPKMYVVAIPGTWETTDKAAKKNPGPGMLAGVTRGLPSDIRADYVHYAATAFPWEGDVYGKSKKEAIDNGRGMIGAMAAKCPTTKIGIVGYSQGADAAGDLAAEIGRGNGVVPPSRVAAVGLLSDPSRSPQDAQVGIPAGGAGAEGARPGGMGWLSGVTRTICAPGDLYCSTSSDDYALRIAGFLAHVSAMNPADFGSYMQEFGSITGDVMTGGGVGMLQGQFTDSANAKRAKQLQHFYNSNVHNDYGYYSVGGESAPQWLHNYLVRQAEG